MANAVYGNRIEWKEIVLDELGVGQVVLLTEGQYKAIYRGWKMIDGTLYLDGALEPSPTGCSADPSPKFWAPIPAWPGQHPVCV